MKLKTMSDEEAANFKAQVTVKSTPFQEIVGLLELARDKHNWSVMEALGASIPSGIGKLWTMSNDQLVQYLQQRFKSRKP
jgi:hypothetical protein